MNNIPQQTAIRLDSFKVVRCNTTIAPDLTDEEYKGANASLNTNVFFPDKPDNKFIVAFSLTIVSDNPERMSIEILCHALFETSDVISNEFKASYFANVNAPAIAFPFVRSFVQTLSINMGVAPIILPSYNFAQAFEEAKHKKQ